MNNYKKIFQELEKHHQNTMLEQFSHYTAFQRLVMVLLSARSKDSTLIPIMQDFFKRYPEPKDVIKLSQKQLEKEFYKIGFYHNKAKNVKELSKIVIEKYHNKIPQTLEELTSLPGVGRKTANCVLAYVFKKPAICVDIHVHRISNRIGFFITKEPQETEKALTKIVEQKDWCKINSLLVDHGQRICLPRNPKCELCSITKFCEYYKKSK